MQNVSSLNSKPVNYEIYPIHAAAHHIYIRTLIFLRTIKIRLAQV